MTAEEAGRKQVAGDGQPDTARCVFLNKMLSCTSCVWLHWDGERQRRGTSCLNEDRLLRARRCWLPASVLLRRGQVQLSSWSSGLLPDSPGLGG